jgi:hypothetical protein
MQRLFQRWISAYVIEDISGTMRNPTRRRLKVGIAVNDTQVAKTHRFHRACRRANVFCPGRGD